MFPATPHLFGITRDKKVVREFADRTNTKTVNQIPLLGARRCHDRLNSPLTMKTLCSSFLAIALAAAAAQTPAPPEPAVIPTELRGGVYLLAGRGGNIALFAGSDGALLVDDQFKERSAMIKEAVGKLTPQPIKWIVNTHFHFDHTEGNENFGAQGVTLISQENTRKRLVTGGRIETFKIDQPATKPVGLPSITFAQSLTLHHGEETIDVVYPGSPAHTDGDAFVFFRKANVVHTGDVFIRPGWPFLDTGNGGSLEGLIRDCEYLLTQINDDTLVIPGHGALAHKSDVVTYVQNLRTARDRFAAALKAGKKPSEIAMSDPLKGLDVKEGNIAKDVFILLALESMTRDAK